MNYYVAYDEDGRPRGVYLRHEDAPLCELRAFCVPAHWAMGTSRGHAMVRDVMEDFVADLAEKRPLPEAVGRAHVRMHEASKAPHGREAATVNRALKLDAPGATLAFLLGFAGLYQSRAEDEEGIRTVWVF